MTPPTSRPSVLRRLAAILSIALVVAVAIATIVLVLDRVGSLLVVLALGAVIVVAVWYAITRAGTTRSGSGSVCDRRSRRRCRRRDRRVGGVVTGVAARPARARSRARPVRAGPRRAYAQGQRDNRHTRACGRARCADHEPQVRRRKGRAVPPRGRVPPSRNRAGRAPARRRPARPRTGCDRPRRRRDRHGRRRRVPGTRREHRCRARRPHGGDPGRHAETTSPSTSGSTATTSWARSTRSATPSSGRWTSPK